MGFEITCPKCGYALSGETARWEAECPLEGRCPECGGEFRWQDVVDPARRLRGWCVEYCLPARFLVAAFWTAVLSLRPRLFWSDLRWARPIKVSRLCAYVAFLLVVFWIVRACMGTLLVPGMIGHSGAHAARWFAWPLFDVKVDFPGVSRGVPFDVRTTPSTWHLAPVNFYVDDSVSWAFLLTIFWPLAFIIMWFVSKGAVFAPKAIARSTAYSLGWLVIAAPLVGANIWRDWLRDPWMEPLGELSIRPATAFEALWRKFNGTGLPNGWLMLEAFALPLLLCAGFAWWWIAAARAHGQRGKSQTVLLSALSVCGLVLWQVRPALLLVWLDLKGFFR